MLCAMAKLGALSPSSANSSLEIPSALGFDAFAVLVTVFAAPWLPSGCFSARREGRDSISRRSFADAMPVELLRDRLSRQVRGHGFECARNAEI